MVCKLHKFISRFKQTSYSWNKCFDQVVKIFDFDQNKDEPCVYKKVQRKMMIFMILYVDNILLISNDVGLLSSIKIWLFTHFQMKDLGEGSIFRGLKSYETERIEN